MCRGSPICVLERELDVFKEPLSKPLAVGEEA